jgi:tRNA nucleotidyltransferase (CCA-adding enzyme)
MMVLRQCALLDAPLPVRWACLVHDLGKGSTPHDQWPRHIGHEQRSANLARAVAERLRVPSDCRELADVVAREHGHVHRSGDLDGAALLRLFERCDALRRPQRFEQVLLACECDARGRAGLEQQPYPSAPRLRRALAAALGIDHAAVAAAALARGRTGEAIGQELRTARIAAVACALQEGSASGQPPESG